MIVKILDITESPCDSIALAAGTSYGKFDTSEKRVKNIIKAGHLSCTEFAYIHFRIEGISRSCLAQLTRHRLMSFCVESQRYNKYSSLMDDWYVIPPEIEADPDKKLVYQAKMEKDMKDYESFLFHGVKPEDARFLLPEATKTKLSCAMNLREFYSFLQLRLNPHAQWEIRMLAQKMYDEVCSYNDQWKTLMDYYWEYIQE